MPPVRNGIPNRGEEDGMFPIFYHSTRPQLTLSRGLPRLQILAILESQHAIPHQPRMLPQDVRVLRGSDILVWPSELPCCRV